jgi:serine/threonine-protein kinase RsbW
MRTAIFSAHLDQLEAIRVFATQAARDAGMDERGVSAVELAVDEACSNIIEHAYQGIEPGDIECTCDAQADSLRIMIRDHGKPFDPNALQEPDLQASLEDRPLGGLGVFLMRNLMDSVRFEPLGQAGNLVTMVRRLRSDP